MVSTDSVLSYDIQITTKISLFTELRLEISYVWVQKSLSFVDIFQISYAVLDILAIPLRAHIYPPLHFQNIVGNKKCWKFSHRLLRYSVLSNWLPCIWWRDSYDWRRRKILWFRRWDSSTYLAPNVVIFSWFLSCICQVVQTTPHHIPSNPITSV